VFVLPNHLSTQLSQEIAEYIPRFVPQRGLTAQQWARCREAVWTSCAATLPPSRVDAKTQMSVTCAFRAFTDGVVGSVQLDLVLTQDLIQRFAIDSEGKIGAGTRHNHRGHLRRALKAAAGDAPRVTHSPRSARGAVRSSGGGQAGRCRVQPGNAGSGAGPRPGRRNWASAHAPDRRWCPPPPPSRPPFDSLDTGSAPHHSALDRLPILSH
jgi:hypothetical protein